MKPLPQNPLDAIRNPPQKPRHRTPAQLKQLQALSPTMRAALALAKKHGGKLTRHPGGYWSGPVFRGDTNGHGCSISFGTSTVESLNSRKQGTYTQWKENGVGRFPIEFTINGTWIPKS